MTHWQADIARLVRFLTEHCLSGKLFDIKITLERWVNKRSKNQNALFHKWCGEIAAEIGDSPEAVKDDLKAMHAPQVEGPLGKLRPKGTSEMTTVEGGGSSGSYSSSGVASSC